MGRCGSTLLSLYLLITFTFPTTPLGSLVAPEPIVNQVDIHFEPPNLEMNPPGSPHVGDPVKVIAHVRLEAKQSWTKYGVVINTGAQGEPDSISLNSPTVIFDGEYKMWYAGTDAPWPKAWIIYANSSDGLTWNKHGVVLAPGPTMENVNVHYPFVMKDGSIYKMWYTGYDGSNYRIFYATSFDGMSWTRYGLVLDLGPQGSYDDYFVYNPFVIKEGIYRMWYSGDSGSNVRLMYATSPDGITWTKQGVALDLGPPGSGENIHVSSCYMLKENSIYHMWYRGYDGTANRIFYATSIDGLNWNRWGMVIDVGPAPTESVHVMFSSVIHRPNMPYQMWYAGRGGSPRTDRIHHAHSDLFPLPLEVDVDFYLDGISPSKKIGTVVAQVGAVATSDAQIDWIAQPTGDHIVYAVVDLQNKISEMSETNNVAMMHVTVLGGPPVADAGGPYQGYEGGVVHLDASGSSDPDNDSLLYRWDFCNDGVWDTPWLTVPTYDNVWGDDYIGTIVLEVSDGGLTDTDDANVTILNVLPSGALSMLTTEQHEGMIIQFSAHATDPGSDDIILTWSWGDGSSNEQSMYYNDGMSPDPYPSPDMNPRNITDLKGHIFGDNGVFTVTVQVKDDDSGPQNVTLQITSTPDNLPPSIVFTGDMSSDEGQTFVLSADATDPGSDDLTFEWSLELGPARTKVHYNNGVTPDPPQSPSGNYPFTASDAFTHKYGDDGLYSIVLKVTDDDGGSSTWSAQHVVRNLPPLVSSFGPFIVDEAAPFTVSTEVTDPGSDDLTLTWTFDYGPVLAMTFNNNGLSPDPPKSPWGIWPFNASSWATHTYGDDGVFTITLTATDDDGGVTAQSTVIEVTNIPPVITAKITVRALVDVTLRVAGEKWHDVVLTLFEDDRAREVASVVRYPGSPDEQAVTIRNVTIDLLSDSLSAVVQYTPHDDAINGQWWGADPAWLILTGEDGNESRIHHTFNVRHNETWKWTITDFRPHLTGIPIRFTATAYDQGSDDLTFIWDAGDGRTFTTVTYNNGVDPDPYPSPEVNPIKTSSEVVFAYNCAGPHKVTLTVVDDDGGSVSESVIFP